MRTAIVVGAGIGGVAAAVALEQCGWQVMVLERAAELGEVGAGISLWPGAVGVLEELGVAGVQKVAAGGGAAGLRRPDGRWVVEVPDFGMELPVMIHRARLHELITGRLGPAVTIRTGTTVTEVTQNATNVTVRGVTKDATRVTARGVSQDATGVAVRGVIEGATGVTVSAWYEEFTAELVVAADGIRSVVRGALQEGYAGPRYSGYTAYRGIAEVETSDGGGETWGRGQRFGFAKLIDGRFYWYATANRPADLPAGSGGAHGDVTKAFADWHDPIPALLAGTPPEAVLQNDIYDLATPLPRFVHGRVVLLGDAAHAMTPNLGRGACSAIEDAGALARHLRAIAGPAERIADSADGSWGSAEAMAGSPESSAGSAEGIAGFSEGSAGIGGSDLEVALGRYGAERRAITAKLVRRSRAVGRVGQLESGVLCAARDGLLGVAGKAASLRGRGRRVEQSRV